MKVFIALLCVAAAAASPQWYHPTMYNMPMMKPVEIKPEEYTKTMEYKTGMPQMYSTGMPQMYTSGLWNQWNVPAVNAYNNWNTFPAYNNWNKVVEMPKVETDYASKGEYVAESAGGVRHVAKREAINPFMIYNNQWNAYPYAQYNPISYTHGYPYMFPVMPKMVHDDTLKAGTPDYASKGEYFAESAGVIHKAKRDADADADAQIFLRSSGIIPTANNFGLRTINPYTIQKPLFNTIQKPLYNTNLYNSNMYNSNMYNTRYMNSGLYPQYFL